MSRVYNFSAGPSMLPEDVLKQAASEMLDYQGTGMSVMEMSHRSKTIGTMAKETEDLFHEVMNIPEDYKVLFLQGGASTQFAMVPLNLMTKNKKADYIDTGNWSKKAIAEAKLYGTVKVPASSADKNYSYIPDLPASYSADADYVHITTNNTIYGTRFTAIPDTGTLPLIADASSNILSEPMDVSKFGIIYAGAQKNLGPAGVTVVIIRKDLIGDTLDCCPTMLKYATHEGKDSMYNTPPTYGIYIIKLVLEHVKKKGGVEGMHELNKKKSGMLYDFLDSSDFYRGTVEKKDRSLMNVPFILTKEGLDERFLENAAKEGLLTLKGHRSVGGMRASMYNAMPVEGAQKLVEFMKEFELKNK